MDRIMRIKYLDSVFILICGIITYFLFISTLYRYSLDITLKLNVINYIINSFCLILMVILLKTGGDIFERKNIKGYL